MPNWTMVSSCLAQAGYPAAEGDLYAASTPFSFSACRIGSGPWSRSASSLPASNSVITVARYLVVEMRV